MGERFEAKLSEELASAIGISKRRVVVDSVTPTSSGGSVISITILPHDGEISSSQAAMKFVQLVGDASSVLYGSEAEDAELCGDLQSAGAYPQSTTDCEWCACSCIFNQTLLTRLHPNLITHRQALDRNDRFFV